MLDATFDNLKPLAITQMPAFAERLVEVGVEQFVNLDVASLTVNFRGPLRLYRRSDDEIISTE